MSVPIRAGRKALVTRRLSGVAFLLVLAGLVSLTVLLYNKAFTEVVRVTLQADRAGNQLSAPTDVKLRGLIVGEVREITATPDGAEIELALDPDEIDQIPSDVRAQLLPKTLFGEKFVSLVIPEGGGSAQSLKAGDVIGQDRSETALETAKVVDDLLPLLQTLKPEQLSTTLNALSTALRDRGERLGANLELVDAYLARFNPSLPTLEQDFRGLADFANTLDAAAPDLLSVIEDLSFSSRAVVDQQDELSGFLDATAAFSDETEAFLRENEQRLVRLSQDSLPSLQAYARYAPEFPCLAAGLTRFQPVVEDSFGRLQPGLHITLEVVTDQNGYVPGDEPEYLDDRGPECYGLPNDTTVPAPDYEYKDGYRDEERAGIGGPSDQDAADDPARALAAPAVQKEVLGMLSAPMLGVAVDEVPDIVSLLFGPMARGTSVVLS
ncbi:MAG: MCE family protein [Mycobacteriales bacterium]|nr:MCE family protein [Mycobacteriales bacterium]